MQNEHYDTPRMSIDSSAMESLDKKIMGNPILQNAFRLMCDGDLLFANRRYSSVVALAVLSLEEIGRYLLSVWATDDSSFRYDKHNLHKMKQGAVASLFAVGAIRDEYKARDVDFSDLGTPQKMATLVHAIQNGYTKEAHFASAVDGKVIETIKWSGIYYDEELAAKGIEPSNITNDNATEIMQLCSKAFMRLSDDGNVAIAKVLFSMLYGKKGSRAD